MTIAIEQFSTVGAKIFQPDGPFSNQTPGLLAFKLGTVIDGDAEAEYTYLQLTVTGALVLQQGTIIGWDNSYQAYLPTTATETQHGGSSIGSFFLGGRVGDPGGLPSSANWPYLYTFPSPGVYGIWVQRSGSALLNLVSAAVTAPAFGNVVTTTTTAGAVDAPTASVGKPIQGLFLAPFSATFTCNNTNGSAVLTAVSTAKGVELGMGITGTGIPAGCFVAAINGNTITLGNITAAGSALCTSTNTGLTATCSRYQFTANTVNGSPILTNVSNISGIYPGSGLGVAGAGIPIGATVLSIGGNSASGFVVTMSANATSTTTSTTFNFTPVVSNTTVVEGLFRWPYMT
jgi:hypothetical protein